MFAQANLESNEASEKATVAVHKGALVTQVSKLFGALFDESAPQFSVSWIVDLLVHLDDLGDMGHGYYIPRESRIVRLTERWGRIAGGLPLELSEHPEGGIESVQCEAVGRLVSVSQNFAPHNRSTEYSEVFDWTTRSPDSLFAELCEGLPEHSASPPPEDATVYYNAKCQRARTRGERWQTKFPNDGFVVARTGSLPTHYQVQVRKTGSAGAEWFEVANEEARKWILLSERIVGTTNGILVRSDGTSSAIFLPDMLPKAWARGIFACASSVTPAEKGWMLEFQTGARAALEV